jgi:hypothetical protein
MAANCESVSDALPTFSFHHQHALKALAGDTGSDWCVSIFLASFRPKQMPTRSQLFFKVSVACRHHDYEQYPQGPRQLLMVHCFVYFNGLNGDIGDLIVLPGSHKTIVSRCKITPKIEPKRAMLLWVKRPSRTLIQGRHRLSFRTSRAARQPQLRVKHPTPSGVCGKLYCDGPFRDLCRKLSIL